MATEGDAARETAPERVRVLASLRGNAITLVQPGFVLVLELPKLDPIAELGIPGELDDHDVGYVDDSGRLAVMSRTGKTATLHIVDPTGPTKLGEVEYRAPARMICIAGDHVLVQAANVLTVVDVTAERPTALPLPVRGTVTAAGRIGVDRFLIAVGGALEEWDANKRAPGRRFRLDQAVDPLFVGGNAQQMWTIPKKHPDVIEVISLSTKSTRRIELAEPVASVAPHPSGQLLAVIGATSREAYVIDLTRSKSVARVDGGALSDVAWLGRTPTLVIKPVGAPMELVTIGLPGDPVDEPAPAPTASRGEPEDVTVKAPPPMPEVPPTQWSRDDITSRLAAWRERNQGKAAWSDDAIAAIAHETTTPANPAVVPPPRTEDGGWRAELARWARSTSAHRTRPAADGLDVIVARFALADTARHALALLYGAYLGGVRIAPVDLADALGWDWREALGTGALGASELVRFGSRDVRLCRELVAALDERPPLHGTLTPDGGAPVTGAVALVAPAEIDRLRIGAWAASTVGPLLVPDDRADARAFVREARIRGLAPLVPWAEYAAALRVPPQPSAIVVEHPDAAATLQLPVVATWAA